MIPAAKLPILTGLYVGAKFIIAAFSKGLYQSQREIAIHRVFTLRENTLLFEPQTRYFKMESVSEPFSSGPASHGARIGTVAHLCLPKS
jgi:hypothetical protein